MKKRIILLYFSFFISLLSFGQKNTQKIIQNYDQTKITLLKKELLQLNKEKQLRINNYLKNNPKKTKKFKIDNIIYEIKDIIDNKPIYLSNNNINSSLATNTNEIRTGGSLGLNLEGESMNIGVWDGEIPLVSHNEFLNYSTTNPVSRVSTPDNISPTSDQHSTHVSGTLIAKGVNSDATGMAPKANLIAYDWNIDDVEATTEASTNGLLISNHSYGIPIYSNGNQTAPNWLMGAYNTDARNWDNIAYLNPYYLMVTAAGNAGMDSYTGGLDPDYDKLTGNKNAKNNLVVANASTFINPVNGDLIQLLIEPSSSQGPSDDGRIKPDIAGDGSSVFSSSNESNSSYATLTGTSMATPNVAGSILLLQELYYDINNSYMKSSSLKGLICHTAKDDTNKIGPDPHFGWGLLDMELAAQTIIDDNNSQALIIENTLNNNDNYSISFTANNLSKLSATICWTDPQGFARNNQLNDSSPALINDLDIRIIDSNNISFFPWKLQLNDVSAPAIKGDNTVDNIEKINIDSPIVGTYTLSVNHKGTLTNGSQDYSLIITGSDLVLNTENFNKDNSNLTIWPNPSNSILNISLSNSISDTTTLELHDIQGRVIFNKKVINYNNIFEEKIDVSKFSKGIYLLNITQQGKTITKKVIIK